MNKMQKTGSRETRSPIRPSLYRKYPKRKHERNRDDGVKVTQLNSEASQINFRIAQLAPEIKQEPPSGGNVSRSVVTGSEDYQRYYLQPLGQYIAANSQQISIQPDQAQAQVNDVKAVVEQPTNFSQPTATACQYLGEPNGKPLQENPQTSTRHNTEAQEARSTEVVEGKSSDEAERNWLRALREEGVKEVKRTEGAASNGLSREYQNEYFKFIKDMGFQRDDVRKSHTLSDAPTQNTGTKVEPGISETPGGTNFQPHLVPIDAVNLQQLQSQNTGGGSQGQVVFVPKLVPYVPTIVPTPSQPEQCTRVQSQGQVYPSFDQALVPPGQVFHSVPMVNPNQSGVPDESHDLNNSGSAEHDQDGQSQHVSRRKQNAPKRRKPKEDSTSKPNKIATDQDCSSSTPAEAPESAVFGALGPTVPQIVGPVVAPGGTPNSGVAFAYITIPVSSLPANQNPGAAAVCNPTQMMQFLDNSAFTPASTSETKSTVQNAAANEAIDLSVESKRRKDQGERVLDEAVGQLEKPVQLVQPLSVPVNPFRQPAPPPGQLGGSLDSARKQTTGLGQLLAPNKSGAWKAETRGTAGTGVGQCDGATVGAFPPQLQSGSLQMTTPPAPTQNEQQMEAPHSFSSLHHARSHAQQHKILQQQQGFAEPQTLPFGHVLTSENNDHMSEPPMFVPMRIPVTMTPEQNPSPSANMSHSQRPPNFLPSNPASFSKLEAASFSSRKQSQFIDLTDDVDDVEDVYSPYDHDDTFPDRKDSVPKPVPASVGHAEEQGDETLQEEQKRLMDNVSKLAELHCEVGALLNESTHILDTLAPPGGTAEKQEPTNKRKKAGGRTGRKLIKYDHKGRRIFKFHEYCPREPSKMIISDRPGYN